MKALLPVICLNWYKGNWYDLKLEQKGKAYFFLDT